MRIQTEEIILGSLQRSVGTGISNVYQRSKAERIGILVSISAVVPSGTLDVDLETSYSPEGPWFITGTSLSDKGVGNWSIWTSDNARYLRVSYAVKNEKVTFLICLVAKEEMR